MPASDILNPHRGWDQKLGDSMNPSYGFTRKRPMTQLNKKPSGSTPYSRETQNTGHSFSLSWIGRTQLVALKLKWYYEQYENGFFTYVDWDGTVGPQGRHYVGRFTSEVVPVETENNKWDVQNVVFEEMPTVAMVRYPSDWAREAVRRYALNDFGDQDLAIYSSQAAGWTQNARNVAGVSVTTMDNPGAAANAGDWGCYEYRGYGFKLYLMSGPEFGQCAAWVDGVEEIAAIDCYAQQDIGPRMVYSMPNLSLDFHRVKVVVNGAKNVAATAGTISWHSLEVMR